ncbi:MAG: 30S ribosomal protein S20 [Phycisphaerales bacterium]|nr:30S ribosomal protein S20 [Phycisphaerales bacterium]
MPNIESAKKRMRQNKQRRARNKWRKERVKVQIRSLLEAIRAKDVDTAETELRKTCSILDKVSSTSTMHKNTAARKKSRLASRVNALRTA